jgi:hypothetical protein
MAFPLFYRPGTYFNIADSKGPKHENFGSEFLTPSKPTLYRWAAYELKENNSFWTFDAPAYGVFSANIVLSA